MRRIFSNLVQWLRSLFASQSAPAGHEAPPPDWESIRQSQPPQHWLDLARSSGPPLQLSRESRAHGAPPQTQPNFRRSAHASTSKEIPRLVVPANTGSTQSRRPQIATTASVPEDRSTKPKKITRVHQAISRLLKPPFFRGSGKDEARTTTVSTQTAHLADVSQRTPAKLAEWSRTKTEAKPSASPLEFDEVYNSQTEPAKFSQDRSSADEPTSIRLRVPDSVRPRRPKAEYAIGLSSPLSQRPAISTENRWPRFKQENQQRERSSFSGSEAVEAQPQKTFTETVLAMVADLWPELPDESHLHEPNPRSVIRTAQRAQQLKHEQRGF